MSVSRLRQRTLKQLMNTVRTRRRRFSETVCSHDPTEIMVFITNRCNFNCNTCPFTQPSPWSPAPGTPDITVERFNAILGNHPGASMVGLVGGEPLLHSDLDVLITSAAARKMTVNLSTNGSLLDESRAHSLLNLPLGYINVSLDGVDADEFRRLRGGSASVYATVRKNIARLAGIRNSIGSPVKLYISFVTDRINLHRIPEFIRTGRDLGVDTVFCQSVLSYQCSEVTTGNDVLWDTPEIRRAIESINLPDDIGFVPPVPVPFDEHDGCRCVRCIHPFKLLAVDGAGNLSPCCVIPPHPRFGNLVENPREWHDGSALQAFRMEMLDDDRDVSEEICLQCWERYSMKE
ncbi:MAG TPA: radical SAM protein [bacterium]|nr:radical SAM protein [bacterium]